MSERSRDSQAALNKLPQGLLSCTMADIAKALGVHKSTVSLALRNQPGVGNELRTRIKNTAQSMGYRPDPFLDAFNFHRLATHPTNTRPVMAFVSDKSSRKAFDESTCHANLLEGARAQAASLGYHVDLFLTGPSQLPPQRLAKVLHTRSIACVIIGAPDKNLSLEALDWSQYCGVVLDSIYPDLALDVITADYRQACRNAVHRLHASGHRRIGLLLSAEEDERLGYRLSAGYLLAARELGLTPAAPCPCIDPRSSDCLRDWSRAEGLDAIVRMPASSPRLPGSRADVPDVSSVVLLAAPEESELAGLSRLHRAMAARAVDILAIRHQSNQRGAALSRSISLVAPDLKVLANAVPNKNSTSL